MALLAALAARAKIFWRAKKTGDKSWAATKNTVDDAIEGCVTMLSEERYDYVMSNIEAIMEESV